MFTGIVEARLPLAHVRSGDFGMELEVDLGPLAAGVALGDSIAIDGCCLTVDRLAGTRVRFHAGRETLGLTQLATRTVGSEVNVERSLRVGDKLGGHMVTGHVDGVAEVTLVQPEPSQTVMAFRLPERLVPEVVLKGSIALDGVSLTLTRVAGPEIAVAVIPHTLEVTTLGRRQVGDRVNVETDMIGKWVRRSVDPVLAELTKEKRS